MNAIDVYNLTRDYNKVRAVDHISFSVEVGEIFGFLGPNGAGKTTTIKMLTGQLRPSKGGASVAGCDIVLDREKLHSRIGVVFEFQNIYERLTARDNLLFTARLYGVCKRRIDEVLQIVGLASHDKERIKTYSNGMKQRLMIARALLPNPEVVFLDEPTKGLDPGMARSIRALVRDLSNRGVTIFLTTHYMDEADQICNSLAVIDDGKIVANDTPANLKNRYGGPTTTLEDVFVSLTGKNLYG